MAQTMTDALRDLVLTYKAALLVSDVKAVDPTCGGYAGGPGQIAPGRAKGGHGTHGERGRIASFGQEVPLSVRLERWLIGAAAYWKHELERERDGVERAGLPPELVDLAASLNGIASKRDGDTSKRGGKPSSSKRAEDRQVLATKGDAIVVGLLFGRTSEAVRKLRERANQDPHTGERLRTERPLTSRDLPETSAG